MGTKKNIGSAIEEQLKGFHSSPDDVVWNAIEAKLKKDKKDRKIIFFWLFGGTAALSLLLIMLSLNSTNLIEIKSTSNPGESKSNLSHHKFDSIPANEIGKRLINETDDALKNQVHLSQINSQNQQIQNKKSNVLFSQNSNKKEENIEIIPNRNNKDIKNTTLKTDSISENKDSLKIVSKKIDKKRKLPINKKDSSSSKPERKWSIYPNVSAHYYGAFAKSTNDQLTLNYGLYLNYLATKDLTIRIGVHKLNLQQTSTGGNSLTLQQKASYIELPFELKYSPFKTKVKTSFIGGFSYLLLEDARLTSTTSNSSLQVSNNTVFNKSTLSVNLGMGFQAKIFKKLHINIEPMFKYHIKPYSESVEYSPFTLSVSSGIEYKF
ncbi:hypothetical protein A9Q87_02195 [Flavobacteriales bacterium 34_180_T64]|nr:hypothetical protein A9Q87_02195 [Flavobacteriales bacterium 34_180_T64]